MPLPAALLAKLSKRGLLESAATQGDNEVHNDYKGSVGCPNKNNIHHECTSWCQIHWKGVLAPDSRYARNVRRLMEKYPLPTNWTEVYDKGIGRYYYWNMETDQVSWLPPKHPKAMPVECAAKQRMRLHRADVDQNQQPQIDKEPERKHHQGSMKEKEKEKDRHYRDRRDRDDTRSSGRKKPRNDDVDPMDPSAYSDVPRGTWSDGLEQNKSKADPTATGVLFQQRPYPSPGEVLSSNKLKFKRNID